MDAKENLLETIHFGNPERVPYAGGLPIIRIGFFGVNPDDNRPPGADIWTDLWQVQHHKEFEGIMPFPKYNPLAHIDDWEEYQWPDPHDPELYVKARATLENISDREAILVSGSHRSTLLERAWKLVGMEDLFVLLLSDEERSNWLLDHIIDFQLGVAEEYLSLGVDFAFLGDDHGTQLGVYMNPELFRKYFKPRYEKLIKLYKSNGCLIQFHSCGNILDLVPDFMDLGIDILNPIQATALDLPTLRRLTEGKMALQGGVSTATVLDGPLELIRTEVRERIQCLGKNGGYICGPDQGFPFPQDHLRCLEDSVDIYGAYPLEV